MKLKDILHITPGITAIIGSGGKTSAMLTLARELPGTVIVATTTHIYPPKGIPMSNPDSDALQALLKRTPLICCGASAEDGKLGPPVLSPAQLAEYADYVLVEADGAKGLPIKAHREKEPVIPRGTEKTVLVIGASGFGKPIGAVCHCAELYSLRSGSRPEQNVSPENLSAVTFAEKLSDCVLINQADVTEALPYAAALRDRLRIPIIYGSIKEAWYQCLY